VTALTPTEETFCNRYLVRLEATVRAAILNGVVEDRGIRSEPHYRKLIDIPLECTPINEVACNLAQPQTLTRL
jgi:hypothetical protein